MAASLQDRQYTWNNERQYTKTSRSKSHPNTSAKPNASNKSRNLETLAPSYTILKNHLSFTPWSRDPILSHRFALQCSDAFTITWRETFTAWINTDKRIAAISLSTSRKGWQLKRYVHNFVNITSFSCVVLRWHRSKSDVAQEIAAISCPNYYSVYTTS